ncbi:MAG: hypothetical protein Q4F84_08390 [Fibrobacter sp.]|nr:hypothetical protein [Fibrobacter sp.]
MLAIYSPAAVCGTPGRYRTVFQWSVKKGYLEKNPFLEVEEVEKGSYVNKSRERFISLETYQRLLDACPDQEWRVIIALCRIGGKYENNFSKKYLSGRAGRMAATVSQLATLYSKIRQKSRRWQENF